MRRRTSMVAGAAALVVTGAALSLFTGIPVQAAPEAGEAQVQVDPAAQSIAAERGVSLGEAERRLGWQRSADALERSVAGALEPGRFGGVWIGADDDRLKVGVKAGSTTGAPRAAAAATAAVGRAAAAEGVADGVDVVAVRWTERELVAANQWVARRIGAANEGADGTLSTGYRTGEAVRIGLPASLTDAQAGLVAEARKKFGPMIETYRSRGVPVATACGFPYCDPPLRGGVSMQSAAGACTTGFISRSRSDGRLFVLTAGHCVTRGTTYHTWFPSDATKHTIGTGHSRVFGASGDAGLVTIANPTGWKPRAWVYVGASPARDGVDGTTRVTEYPITGDGSSRVGLRVCKTGATAETTCGRVDALDVTVDYDNGPVVHHLAQANLCVRPGDSGGPVYSYNTAYGLVSGHINGTACASLYQGVRGAENLLNVNVAFD